MLYQLLAERAAQFPTKAAVIGETRSVSFEQLFAEAGNIAFYLDKLGLRPGQAVVLGIPPTPEFHAALFGAAAVGLQIIVALPSGKIPVAVQRAEPVLAIGDQAFLEGARERCSSLRYSIEWSRVGGLQIDRPGIAFSRSRQFRSENILAVSSSGTTGEPSLYLRSAEMLVRRAEMRSAAHGIRADDVLLATRPYNSGSAINNHVVMPVYAGCGIVVHERFERFKAARAIAEARVTALYAVPFIYEMLASIPVSRACDFSSVRLCVAGGAPLAPSVARAFYERFGLVLRQRYAGSHIHPAFSFNADGPPDSVGKLNGIFPIVILREDGRPAQTDEIGEIAFSCAGAPVVWRESLQRNPNRRGDYIFSGDLGRADAAGNVFVVGRKSAFIKVAGNRVEPAEVEDVLRRHPHVSDALVYRGAIGAGDESVEAEVAATEGVTEQELLEYCKQHLDPYKCPHRIAIKSELSRNVHGKVPRRIVESLMGVGAAFLCDFPWQGVA